MGDYPFTRGPKCPRKRKLQRRAAKRKRNWSRVARAPRPKRRGMNVLSRKEKRVAWNWLRRIKSAWDSTALRYSIDPRSMGIARSQLLYIIQGLNESTTVLPCMLMYNLVQLAICTGYSSCVYAYLIYIDHTYWLMLCSCVLYVHVLQVAAIHLNVMYSMSIWSAL